MEPTLNDHLDGLRAALEEYRGSVRKMQEHFAFEVEALWKDQADLRDEVNQTATALGNRIEGLTRGLTADPAEVAEKITATAPRNLDEAAARALGRFPFDGSVPDA